jgi:1,4-dihydroxy-2-naphthoate polyprenyltransferase
MPNTTGQVMQLASGIKIWLRQVRAPFLVLPAALVLLGTAIARSEGYFEPVRFILTFFGLLLAHISVNVFNEYSDYKTGIDFNTTRTPFSGGSGVLQQKLLSPKTVYIFAVFCLATAFFIGMYLVLQAGWQLLPLILFGGLTCYFYTSHLAKLPVAELFAGLGLGSLPVIGTYVVQTGHYSPEAIVASISPGILTANLLFLNEFPDYEADKSGGRGHLVITLGKKRSAAVYAALTGMVYLGIIVPVILKIMPVTGLVALISLPAAIQAVRITMKCYDDSPSLTAALKANVLVVLGTDFLLAAGYFISMF